MKLGILEGFEIWRKRQGRWRELERLSDRDLRDIGLSRTDVMGRIKRGL